MFTSIHLNPHSVDVRELGLGPYPFEDKVHGLLDGPTPADWSPTGIAKSAYLDRVERLVRYSLDHWQQDDGSSVNESGERFSPFRLVLPAATLLREGRIGASGDRIFQAMDQVCAAFAADEVMPHFAVNELAVAWWLLRDHAPAKQVERWRTILAEFDPAEAYRQGGNHNWRVYAAGAEYLREVAGLHPTEPCEYGAAFFDREMREQLQHINVLGMYRDPNDPMVYDMATRLRFALPIAAGYDGPLRPTLEELLRRGGLTTLLYISPTGHAPFGGRSDQFCFMEAMVAFLCELEAIRYRDHDEALAGAFRRQAGLSTSSIDRWIMDMTPPKASKNAFAPEQRHGHEPYRGHHNDVHFVASLLSLAAMVCDDAIAERPCPSEIGGYVCELTPGFHKVIASCGGSGVVIDARADLHYNATGLGRYVRRGAPLELGLGMPIPGPPTPGGFTLNWADPEAQSSEPIALGPRWRVGGQWHSLAGLCSDLEYEVRVFEQSAERVSFAVLYRGEGIDWILEERFTLTADELALRCRLVLKKAASREGARMAYRVPLLVTDGSDPTEIEQAATSTVVRHQGGAYHIACPEGCEARLLQRPLANRHGLYRVLEWSGEGTEMAVLLALSSADRH